MAKCGRELYDFISTVFTRTNEDGIIRTILNLKHLNKFVKYHHFEMESLLDAFKIIQPSCWMVSVDLKDAFYSIRFNENFQKILNGLANSTFHGVPIGCSEARRIFTRILKPTFVTLGKQGYLSVTFIDNSYLQRSAGEESSSIVKKQ